MTRPTHPLPHLLTQWEPIAARLRESRRVAVFLDFDGTLVPIVSRPDQVHVPVATRRSLGRLAKLSHVSVTVVSGRRRNDLLRHIAVQGIHYVGLYGWERDNRSAIPTSAQIALRRARALLDEHLSMFPDVWIEDKDSSLSIHFLAAKPGVESRARRSVSLLLRPFAKNLRLFKNQRDIEIAPLCVPDKGTAVRQSLAAKGFRNALPLYFGDDYSDESGFDAVRQGVAVFVGKHRRTRAQFHLRGPDEVARTLIRLEAALA